MKILEEFKQARIAKGLTKMDWVTCLAEGKKKKKGFAQLYMTLKGYWVIFLLYKTYIYI